MKISYSVIVVCILGFFTGTLVDARGRRRKEHRRPVIANEVSQSINATWTNTKISKDEDNLQPKLEDDVTRFLNSTSSDAKDKKVLENRQPIQSDVTQFFNATSSDARSKEPGKNRQSGIKEDVTRFFNATSDDTDKTQKVEMEKNRHRQMENDVSRFLNRSSNLVNDEIRNENRRSDTDDDLSTVLKEIPHNGKHPHSTSAQKSKNFDVRGKLQGNRRSHDDVQLLSGISDNVRGKKYEKNRHSNIADDVPRSSGETLDDKEVEKFPEKQHRKNDDDFSPVFAKGFAELNTKNQENGNGNIEGVERVKVTVYRGPTKRIYGEQFTPWGYWVSQPITGT